MLVFSARVGLPRDYRKVTIMPQATTNQTDSTPKTFDQLSEEGKREFLKNTFGAGKYYSIQCEMFRDGKRILNLADDKSVKLAKAIATHLGAVFGRGQVEIKGIDKKLTKDGALSSISEICKLKNLPVSYEIAVMRAFDYINKAARFHVRIGEVYLQDDIAEWVEKL